MCTGSQGKLGALSTESSKAMTRNKALDPNKIQVWRVGLGRSGSMPGGLTGGFFMQGRF
jgi:hypothetical protein